MSLDRLASNELVMTQEPIANTLGERREGITEAAGHLHDAGLIRHHRSHIAVRGRAGLERRTCKCYDAIREECERLLPAKTAI